ncbi:hypothetical protein ACHAWF_003992 [Thalassiosira exigua]
MKPLFSPHLTHTRTRAPLTSNHIQLIWSYCYLAARTADEVSPVGRLILHAISLSVYPIVLESSYSLPGDRFSNVDFALWIQPPVLFIHGTKEPIVLIHHSKQLLETIRDNCQAELVFVKGMGHNNVQASARPLFIDWLRR